MRKIIHFPLNSDTFSHQFGIKSLGKDEPIITRTEDYQKEIEMKRILLSEHPEYYSHSMPEGSKSEIETSTLLTGTSNSLLKTAKEIQEDLVILNGDTSSGHPIIAGVVCFPNGWTINEKIGMGIDQIHDPVPEYAEVMSNAVNKLLKNLRPGRTFWRTNWAIRPTNLLDQSPRMKPLVEEAESRLNHENVSENCFFRVEYQTLTRLSGSGDILFTILTDQLPVIRLE
ncbi:MAG: heme-dependent oxidative N-demethylase family protein, partial [Verrucomicrobiales bacterium]